MTSVLLTKDDRALRWGILGVSRFALKKSVPRMLRGEMTSVVAVASRDLERASFEASRLSIPKAYGSYDALLADPQVEAVYIPLPNHLHAEWTAKAARAGKHVLCEKPISMNAREAQSLLAVQKETGVVIAEAFMVRSHPQWIAARNLIAEGRIGRLQCISYLFSYNNSDPMNIRNIRAAGGGALLDIGCYAVNTARWLFRGEPHRVFAFGEEDPQFGTDRLTSGILQFAEGHATFTCATQLVPFERVQILGSAGRIEMQVPFKAPPESVMRLEVDDGKDVFGRGIETVSLPLADQFALQADNFGRAVRSGTSPDNSLEDAALGMRTIDALFRSIQTGRAAVPAPPDLVETLILRNGDATSTYDAAR